MNQALDSARASNIEYRIKHAMTYTEEDVKWLSQYKKRTAQVPNENVTLVFDWMKSCRTQWPYMTKTGQRAEVEELLKRLGLSAS